MAEPTEDVPYSISDHAVADDKKDNDLDETTQAPVNNANKIVKSITTYIDEAIVEHSGFDLIDLTEQAKMTPTQQIAVQKLVINHLRNIKDTITNKVEELKDV